MTSLNVELLLKPISEASPTGEESKYEFCYELMELEIKKFGSLFGETVDWKVVETNAIEVLTTYSKDLKAICYLIRALIERNGFIGLDEGLNLLKQSLVLFGTDLFPQRKRARDGAMEWFVAQLETTLPKLDTSTTNWESVASYLQRINEISDQYHEAFSDSDVEFYLITSVLNGISQRVVGVSETNTNTSVKMTSEPEPLVEETTSAVTEVKTPSQVATKVPKTVNTVKQEVDIDTDFSSPSASKRTLKKVAEFMLHSDISTPLAYRLHRNCTWCEVDELPPHDNDKKTPLSLAVSQDQLSEYRDKAKQETEAEVIKRLERTLTDAPFWLTGHYLMFQMLTNLDHHEAAEAVKQETQYFISQLEGIELLTFANSTPFADEETLKWLSSNTTTTPVAVAAVSVDYTEDDSLIEGEITLENLGEYVSRIAQNLASDPSGRGQWMLHYKLVKAYRFVGLLPLCLPYIEKMWSIKEEINLSNWEPHLCNQLDLLANEVLSEMYSVKEHMPEKYQQWLSINNTN